MGFSQLLCQHVGRLLRQIFRLAGGDGHEAVLLVLLEALKFLNRPSAKSAAQSGTLVAAASALILFATSCGFPQKTYAISFVERLFAIVAEY